MVNSTSWKIKSFALSLEKGFGSTCLDDFYYGCISLFSFCEFFFPINYLIRIDIVIATEVSSSGWVSWVCEWGGLQVTDNVSCKKKLISSLNFLAQVAMCFICGIYNPNNFYVWIVFDPATSRIPLFFQLLMDLQRVSCWYTYVIFSRVLLVRF